MVLIRIIKQKRTWRITKYLIHLHLTILFGPFIIIAIAASTILYLNSSKQLKKKLLEMKNIEGIKKLKGTKSK